MPDPPVPPYYFFILLGNKKSFLIRTVSLAIHTHLSYECVDAFVYKMLYHTFHKEEMYFVLCLVMMYRAILYAKCSLH